MKYLGRVFRLAGVARDVVGEWLAEAERDFEQVIKPGFPDGPAQQGLRVSHGKDNNKAAGVRRGRLLLDRCLSRLDLIGRI